MTPPRVPGGDRPAGAVAGAAPRGELDLVGFGEAMVLVAPAGGQPLASATTATLHVAGAELNVCAAAAALGARTAFASRVGADPFGERIRAASRALGVGTDLVTTSADAPTGVFFKDVRPDGQRRVHYYRAGSAASRMDATDAERILGSRPALVVVSGITAALGDGPHEAVRALLHGARAAGVRVALDPNLRPTLGDLAEQVGRLRPLLSTVDTLLLGTDEAPALLDAGQPGAVFEAAAAAGVGETVLKAGPDGCWVLDGGRPRHLPSAAATVVDPVGAGDALAGGYLVGRERGLSPYQAAWLGSQLAARVLASSGDTDGLPDRVTAARLLDAAAAVG